MNANIKQAAAYLRRAAEDMKHEIDTLKHQIDDMHRGGNDDIGKKEMMIAASEKRLKESDKTGDRMIMHDQIKGLAHEIDRAKSSISQDVTNAEQTIRDYEGRMHQLLQLAGDLENQA